MSIFLRSRPSPLPSLSMRPSRDVVASTSTSSPSSTHHPQRPFRKAAILFFLFLLLRRVHGADYLDRAYGVHRDFQGIAHTRLAQLREKTLLDCAASGDVEWYRRSLMSNSAGLGTQEAVRETLLVDWKWTSKKEKDKLKKENPQIYKFELKDSGLIIHDSRWHDLGQYYCVVGGNVQTIYLLYQRPIILFADAEDKIKEQKLEDPGAISDPNTLMNRLDSLREAHEFPLTLGEKGVITALWRSYPFVDSASSGPASLGHSGYEWDGGDVCRWLNKKEHEKSKKLAFTGKMGVDVELIKSDKRYSFSFDAAAGMLKWTINPVERQDEKNKSLCVQTSRGASYAFFNLRAKDPRAYVVPLIVIVVEIVITIILTVIFQLIAKRKQKKADERQSFDVSVGSSHQTIGDDDERKSGSIPTSNFNAQGGSTDAGAGKITADVPSTDSRPELGPSSFGDGRDREQQPSERNPGEKPGGNKR